MILGHVPARFSTYALARLLLVCSAAPVVADPRCARAHVSAGLLMTWPVTTAVLLGFIVRSAAQPWRSRARECSETLFCFRCSVRDTKKPPLAGRRESIGRR